MYEKAGGRICWVENYPMYTKKNYLLYIKNHKGRKLPDVEE